MQATFVQSNVVPATFAQSEFVLRGLVNKMPLFLFGVSLLGAAAGPVNKMPLFLFGVSLLGAAAGPVNKMPLFLVVSLLGAAAGPVNKMPANFVAGFACFPS